MANPLNKFSAKIKDVYVELKDYQFLHSPYHGVDAKHRYIGRQRVKERILSILGRTDVKAGSYLITGFRGMGKTSVIREAIDDFNKSVGPKFGLRAQMIKEVRYAAGEIAKLGRILLLYLIAGAFLHWSILSPPEGGYKLWGYFWANIGSIRITAVVAILCALLITWTRVVSRDEDGLHKLFGRKDIKRWENPAFVLEMFTCLLLLALPPILSIARESGAWIVGLSFVVSIHLVLVYFSEGIFRATWAPFRTLLMIGVFLASIAFIVDYNYVCSQFTDLCSEPAKGFMNRYFPVAAKEWGARPEGTGSGVFGLLYRLVIGFSLGYVLLSSAFFFVDLVSLVWGKAISNLGWDSVLPNSSISATVKAKYKRFEINLSQDALEELDVLRRIAIALEDYWRRERYVLGRPVFNRKFYFIWRILRQVMSRGRQESFAPGYESVLANLTSLRKRLSGSVTLTTEQRIGPSLKTELVGGLAELAMPIGGLASHDQVAYPVASAKEAEDQLIAVFREIDQLRRRNDWYVPEFAFVIDELDKIGPYQAGLIEQDEASNPLLSASTYAQDTNYLRARREAVARLLANLKGFLNVVPAKFFFIGGREMFDADLADIADRESFYSSVFNDVLYVESFFKDRIEDRSSVPGGITQMTEAYLMNIVLGKYVPGDRVYGLKDLFNSMRGFGDALIIGEPRNQEAGRSKRPRRVGFMKRLKFLLKTQQAFETDLDLQSKDTRSPRFARWLRSYFKDEKTVRPNEPGSATLAHLDSEEDRQKKRKVIFTLKNYIVYLMYRSNGTPKKLTGLTEQQIVRGPAPNNGSNASFFEENLVVLANDAEDPAYADLSKRLFLKFGFNIQYEIGLTANIYQPFLVANSRQLTSLGDKLLFSSSFIIDHILKFHPFGFSWRNLELIPEVVLVNREPNLREFIEELMRFYSMSHIRDAVSGIFDYRFRSIIRRELMYLSKTSDLGSAAFNFTLDESLSTKRHYRRKLIELIEKYKSYTPADGDNHFVHAMCFVQTILGDLHFYDKEYDEAIIFYTESIQTLRLPHAVESGKMTRHQFLLWLRNKLKLALTLEKIRAFDSAFSIYKTLVVDADRYLSESIDEDDDVRTIQLVSMPFIALLACIEKVRNDGISYTNLAENRDAFLRTINANSGRSRKDRYRKNFLRGDYYNNIGSVLYYKNCSLTRYYSTEGADDAFRLEAFSSDGVISQQRRAYSQHTEHREIFFFPSLTAFSFYWNSLYFLLEYHAKQIVEAITKRTDSAPAEAPRLALGENLLAICAGYLLPNCVDLAGSTRLYYNANVVSKIGDAILSSLSSAALPDLEQIEPFDLLDLTTAPTGGPQYEALVDRNIKRLRVLGDRLFSIETVLMAYKLSAAMYKRSGNTSFYAAHLIRMLYVIKDIVELNKKNENFAGSLKKFLGVGDGGTVMDVFEKVAAEVFSATTSNNEATSRPQIMHYREIFGSEVGAQEDREAIFNNINSITDNKEVIILVESLRIKLRQVPGLEADTKNFTSKFIASKKLISSYGPINNRYQRMLELKYRTERCYTILKHDLGLGDIASPTVPQLTDAKRRAVLNNLANLPPILGGANQSICLSDALEFVILEALFASYQLIKMIKLYNPGYVIGYSFIAEAHRRMAYWCRVWENYKSLKGDANADDLDAKIRKVLGSGSGPFMESDVHREASVQYYYKMVQMHTDGKSYKDKLHEVFMLEDDYNDSVAHYTIAGERLRINSGIIREKISDLKGDLSTSTLYEYSSYVDDGQSAAVEALNRNIREAYKTLFESRIPD